MNGGVFIYVQYLLGIGHLQRSLQIADALAFMDMPVTLVCGGPPVALPRRPAIRFVQLPAVRARDAGFELIDEAGRPLDDALRAERRTALLAAFAEARPRALVIEGFPFARRAFRFELDPLIAAAQTARPRPGIVSSVRDILVMRDDPERHRAIAERVRRDFDLVLAHGDPAFIRLDASFPAALQIADRILYTGYVCPPEQGTAAADIGAGEVVVSAGGGAAGFRLLQTALAARRAGCLAGLRWRILAGANLPEAEFAALAADPGVVVERFRPDLMSLLRVCRVSVSQAGYNTVLDLLRARARAVLVPFAEGRETEQLVRAERPAELGAVELVRESDLTPARLGAAIKRAAAHEPAAVPLDLDGARRSAQAIRDLTERRYLAAGAGKGMNSQ